MCCQNIGPLVFKIKFPICHLIHRKYVKVKNIICFDVKKEKKKKITRIIRAKANDQN